MKNRKSIAKVLLATVAVGAAFGGVCFATGNCQNLSNPFASKATANVSSQNAPKKEVLWHHTLDEALKESKSSGKPIFVDFYATWCPPCHMMNDKTFPDPTFTAEAQNWVLLKIDTDKEIATAMKYGVSGLPTLAALHPDGKPIAGVSGYHDAGELVEFMHKAKEQLPAKN